MIQRLPRYAELRLATLCAEAGALCHAVDEDESGWDRLIEFPETDLSGPADRRPPRHAAYVQVKSKRNPPFTIKIKLSNALRAAQSPQPWFIVLISGKIGNRPPRVFAVHVWSDMITKTLESTRIADSNNRKLNKKDFIVHFGPEDEKNEDLVPWMLKEIESIKAPYEAQKRQINAIAGYEDSCGTALLKIEANDVEEIVREFLGLGDGLRFSQFVFTEQRFGIASRTPDINEASGIVRITPQPVGEIEVRLRGPQGSSPIVLQGHAYGAGLPGIADNQKAVRLSAGFLELIWRKGRPIDFHADLEGSREYDIWYLKQYSIFCGWIQSDSVDVQVWSKEKRTLGGTVKYAISKNEVNWPAISQAIDLLITLAGHDRFKVCLNDIYSSSGLMTLTEIAMAGNICLEMEPWVALPPSPFTHIVYWYYVEVGTSIFFAVTERPVAQDVTNSDGSRRIIATRGNIIESFLVKDSLMATRKTIENDYERHCSKLNRDANPLELGDLRAFIEATIAWQQTKT